MPNRPQKKKLVKTMEKARIRNKAKRSAMRTQIKRVLAAVSSGDKTSATKELVMAYKRIDKCAKHRVIHPNTAARRKAGLAHQVNAIV
jgi:small subunit ribosomal protein S20